MYTDLIKNLKEQGAFLNTIRPHYLLSYHDFLTYSRTLNNEFISPMGQKLSENKFNYLSIDSWTTLFY